MRNNSNNSRSGNEETPPADVTQLRMILLPEVRYVYIISSKLSSFYTIVRGIIGPVLTSHFLTCDRFGDFLLYEKLACVKKLEQ